MTRPVGVTPRRGVILPLMCLLLPMLLIVSALAINLAYRQLAQTELQVATDAGVRAAGRVFAETGDLNAALIKAQEAGSRNLVCGQPQLFRLQDLETGTSIRPGLAARYDFAPSPVNPNAVRLTGARTQNSLNGPIRAYLPTFVGSNQLELQAVAVASQVEVDLMLVFDRSGSMAYAADEPAVHPPIPAAAPANWFFGDPIPPDSRWLDAVQATVGLLVRLQRTPQSEAVGLVTYANEAVLDCDLTSDYLNLTGTVDQYSAAFPGGGTNIEEGIVRGRNALIESLNARPFAAKVLILMTDGRANLGGDPIAAAESAAAEGIMTFTVTFALEADQNKMEQVAIAGKGKHFHAQTGADLLRVFEEIGKTLPNLITQ